MRKCVVVVNKVLFYNNETSYGIFQGVVLKWAPRKKVYTETKESHTFVGQFLCLYLGDRLEVEAEETVNPVYGPQYTVLTSKRLEPVSLTEIRTFLAKNIKGMNPKRLNAVMDKYGLDAIRSIIDDPHAYDFLGLEQAVVDDLRSSLIQNAAFEDTLAYLQTHDMDCRYAQPLFQKYHERVSIVLDDNPYLPFIEEIYSFKVADALYLTLKKPADAPKRCLYVVLATLQMDVKQKGNVYIRRSELKQKLTAFLTDTVSGSDESVCPFTDTAIDNAVTQLENSGLIVIDGVFVSDAIYLRQNYYDEQQIATCIQALMSEPKNIAYQASDISNFLVQYEKTTGFVLDTAQKDAVKMALTSPISIISGGPGTGKTQTINAVQSAIRALAPNAKIRACAPTGKAAIRIQELTGIPAGTIHRTINLAPFKTPKKAGDLACDYIFVDEFSMVDVHLCAKLLDAVNSCGRVVLVGDYHQLPSVGPGLVLKDLIESNVIPKVILNKVFRQAGSSRIVTNAHAIINQATGKDLVLDIAETSGQDFYFMVEQDPVKILELTKRAVKQAKTNYGYDLGSVQVLSPVHFGLLGTDNINFELQQLNQTKATIEFEDKEFRLGDKVAHIENDYDLEVFNGEIGFISDIAYAKQRALQVSYPDRDVWYPYSALSELDLAYSLTVHKMQGSEYPVIIMPIHDVQGQGLSKNLIYTALTRAKKMVILIGSPSALASGLRRETSIDRKSNLSPRLQRIFRP